MNEQNKRQNNMNSVYIQAFINFKQNVYSSLLPKNEFSINNVCIANNRHTLFELNNDD